MGFDNQEQNQMNDSDQLLGSPNGVGNDEANSSTNQEEEFVPDPNMQTLDLSGQYIDDLEPLIKLVFNKMPNLRELNLSNNMIGSLPVELCRNYLPMLESINLNGNQIAQDEEPFSSVVEALSLIGQNNVTGLDGSSLSQGVGGLKVLFISLTREDQVDFILRKLPRLEFLNGLAVDREELYSSQGDERAQTGEDQMEDNDSKDPINIHDGGDSNSLVQVMEDKHEMFGVGPLHEDDDEDDEEEQAHFNAAQPDFINDQHQNQQPFTIKDSSSEKRDTQDNSNALRQLIDDEDLAHAQS